MSMSNTTRRGVRRIRVRSDAFSRLGLLLAETVTMRLFDTISSTFSSSWVRLLYVCLFASKTAIKRMVCRTEYEAITPELSFVDFQGTETTDWINVGPQTVLYLLVTNANGEDFSRVDVEAVYRQVAKDGDTS